MKNTHMLNTKNILNPISKKSDWKLPLGIAILASTLIFIAFELKYPQFFMRGDNADWYTSEYIYSIRCISEGKFPLYCFNEFCGQRYFASGQSGVLNPVIFFAAVLSIFFSGEAYYMIDILAYLSIILGCIGSFFLLKRLGCSDLSAIIGSIAWNFNCYNIWESTGWILVLYTTSLFPYFILTSLLLSNKITVKNIIMAIIPRVYLIYLGHPQFFIFGAIFDCIFSGFLLLVKNKDNKLTAILRLIKSYIIVYVSVAILSAPLLIPEFQYMQISNGYGENRSLDNLTSELVFDSTAFAFPFLYSRENNTLFYPPYIGCFLSIVLIIGFSLPVFLFMGRINKKYDEPIKTMLSAFPCLILGFLLLFFHDIYRLIILIPILNRFQYYHRITIFYSAFKVIAACLSLTVISDLLKHKLKHAVNFTTSFFNIIKTSLVCLITLSYILLYTCTPHIGRGVLFDTSKIYSEEFAQQFSEGRYVTIGFHFDSNQINKKYFDLSENISYNLNKLYNINNVSGYIYDVISKDVIDNECFNHMHYFSGSIFEVYPGFVEQMREQSVCWYIVNPKGYDVLKEYFEEYNIEFVKDTGFSVILYDSYAQPYAYDSNEDKIDLLQDVNSLTLNTNSDFAGGDITLNYTYDPNFRCYIDGTSSSITNDPKHWQFKINCEPGEHEIIIRYEDPAFNACCFFSAAYISLSISGIIIYKALKKAKQSNQYKPNKNRQE